MATRTLVKLSFFLFMFSGAAQLVVNDPTANAALMKQLAQGVQTVEQTTKTVKLLKETKEMYDDINSALQTLDYISDMSIISNQIMENSGKFLQELQATNLFSNKEMVSMAKNYGHMMTRGNSILKVSNDLLSGGIFKMSDADRMQLLKAYKSELSQALADTRIARKRYMVVAQRRMMYQTFNAQGND